MKITHCPITGNDDPVLYLNLGTIPLVNNLCETEEESYSAQRYPLKLQFFQESMLTSLTDVVDRNELFQNYFYQSSVNKPYLSHCSSMYKYISNFVTLQSNDVIVDVGGNDGGLLYEFKKINSSLRYVNVDPSYTFIQSNKEKGIEYINDYFSKDLILPNRTKVITSTNVFQHNTDIRSFVKGVVKNLAWDGIWCLEFPYFFTTMITDNYDQVYHEHVYYYKLQNIIDLLAQEGLRIINVSYHSIHAGTLRVISVHNNSNRLPDITTQSFLNLETTFTPEFYMAWGNKIKDKINSFYSFIMELTKKYNVACFGAAAKGCVFLNTCGLNAESLRYVVDDTPYKQGKFIPGTGLKVVDRNVLHDDKIDYLIILAHNFKDYIMESLREQYKGRFIVMFPAIQVL